MTNESDKTVIATAKIHRMLKELGIARISKEASVVLSKYINELVGELGQKAFKYTQAGARATVSDKDMLSAVKDKCPDFTFEITE